MIKSETHSFNAAQSENDALSFLFLFAISFIFFLLLIFFFSFGDFANLNISIRFASILLFDLAVKDIHGVVGIVDQLASLTKLATLRTAIIL